MTPSKTSHSALYRAPPQFLFSSSRVTSELLLTPPCPTEWLWMPLNAATECPNSCTPKISHIHLAPEHGHQLSGLSDAVSLMLVNFHKLFINLLCESWPLKMWRCCNDGHKTQLNSTVADLGCMVCVKIVGQHLWQLCRIACKTIPVLIKATRVVGYNELRRLMMDVRGKLWQLTGN